MTVKQQSRDQRVCVGSVLGGFQAAGQKPEQPSLTSYPGQLEGGWTGDFLRFPSTWITSVFLSYDLVLCVCWNGHVEPQAGWIIKTEQKSGQWASQAEDATARTLTTETPIATT